MRFLIAYSIGRVNGNHKRVIPQRCHRVATGTVLMAKQKLRDGVPTWTPNQIVASNLNRLRQRRRLTQAEAAHELSRYSGKTWTEAMVAHAERSVTGNRIREFTADDLVAMARAFDVPALYFLTPPPEGLFIGVPDAQPYGVSTFTMLEAVLGRLDNLSEWEALLDEWDFAKDDELPFPRSEERRKQVKAIAQELSLIRAHHLIRRHFKGNLFELQQTLRSLADLVRHVHTREIFAELDENDYLERLQAMRDDSEKEARLFRAKAAIENLELESEDDVG